MFHSFASQTFGFVSDFGLTPHLQFDRLHHVVERWDSKQTIRWDDVALYGESASYASAICPSRDSCVKRPAGMIRASGFPGMPSAGHFSIPAASALWYTPWEAEVAPMLPGEWHGLCAVIQCQHPRWITPDSKWKQSPRKGGGTKR